MKEATLDSKSYSHYKEERYLKSARLQNGECPECGAYLDHTEGCQLCRCCGWSVCGS